MKNFAKFIVQILVLIAVVTGCDSGISSQIEKCVQAGMAANEPYKDSAEKSGTELQVRGYCLRSAAGKE